jgi:hypothetical protein
VYLKGAVFFATNRTVKSVKAIRDELESAGWIRVYTVGGEEYLEIVGWSDLNAVTGQRLDKPKPAKFPGPDSVQSENVPGTVRERSKTDGMGGDGIGGEGRGEEIPHDWQPERSRANLEAESEVRARGIDVDREIAKFRDYYKSKAGRRHDWDAAYRVWLRNARPARDPRVGRVEPHDPSAYEDGGAPF